MNTQLALIELPIESFSGPAPHESNTQPKKKRPRGSSHPEDSWKLSREEKQQGLAGVRAIRAILSQHSPEQDISLQKAS